MYPHGRIDGYGEIGPKAVLKHSADTSQNCVQPLRLNVFVRLSRLRSGETFWSVLCRLSPSVSAGTRNMRPSGRDSRSGLLFGFGASAHLAISVLQAGLRGGEYDPEDARDFLRIAAEIRLRPRVTEFSLEQANEALRSVKKDAVDGAAVMAP
jgi:hypothetical protein